MKKRLLITLCLSAYTLQAGSWTAPSRNWTNRDLRNANRILNQANDPAQLKAMLQKIYADAGTDPNNLGRYGQLFMESAQTKWQQLIQEQPWTSQTRSIQGQFPYPGMTMGGTNSGNTSGMPITPTNPSTVTPTRTPTPTPSTSTSTQTIPVSPQPTPPSKTTPSTIPTPASSTPTPAQKIPPVPLLPPLIPGAQVPPPPPLVPRGGFGPAAKKVIPGVYFDGLCKKAADLAVPSGINKNNQAFWIAISNKKFFNPNILAKFNPTTTVGTVIDELTPLQEDLITGLENTDVKKMLVSLQNKQRGELFNAETFETDFSDILQQLYKANEKIFWHVLDLNCPVRNLVEALNATFDPLQRALPPVKPLTDKLAELVINLYQPENYDIGTLADYDACIQKIPAGEFKDAFQNTLTQVISIAHALTFIATNQSLIKEIAHAQKAAAQSIEMVNDSIDTIKTKSDDYLDTTLRPELQSGATLDEIKEKRDTFNDDKAKELKLADTIKEATEQIAKTTQKLKPLVTEFNKELAQLMAIIIDTNAPDRDVVAKNPTTKIKRYNAELFAQIISQLSGKTSPKETPKQSNAATLLEQERKYAQYVTDAPEDFTGKNPFAFAAVNVLFSNPGSETANDKLKMQIGILKKDFNAAPDPLESLRNKPKQKSQAEPLINPDGSVDLYVWGPEVKDLQDVYLYNRTIGVNKTGTVYLTVRINNPLPPFDVNSKLYKIATCSAKHIQYLLKHNLKPIDRTTTNVSDYIFKPLLEKIKDFLPKN